MNQERLNVLLVIKLYGVCCILFLGLTMFLILKEFGGLWIFISVVASCYCFGGAITNWLYKLK